MKDKLRYIARRRKFGKLPRALKSTLDMMFQAMLINIAKMRTESLRTGHPLVNEADLQKAADALMDEEKWAMYVYELGLIIMGKIGNPKQLTTKMMALRIASERVENVLRATGVLTAGGFKHEA